MSEFQERARQLGAISEYEADGDGRVYAAYENGEVLPMGITVKGLAGRSNVTQDEFNAAVLKEMRGAS